MNIQEIKIKLSKAIDMITNSIDGKMSDEPEVAAANEILCEIYNEIKDEA